MLEQLVSAIMSYASTPRIASSPSPGPYESLGRSLDRLIGLLVTSSTLAFLTYSCNKYYRKGKKGISKAYEKKDKGTCHCSKIKFDVKLPSGVRYCDSKGKIRYLWCKLGLKNFKVVRGEGDMTLYYVRNEKGGIGCHSFCSTCGSNIFKVEKGEDEVYVNMFLVESENIEHVEWKERGVGEGGRWIAGESFGNSTNIPTPPQPFTDITNTAPPSSKPSPPHVSPPPKRSSFVTNCGSPTALMAFDAFEKQVKVFDQFEKKVTQHIRSTNRSSGPSSYDAQVSPRKAKREKERLETPMRNQMKYYLRRHLEEEMENKGI
ncbi:hypothetical protein TrVE_jg12293 [Triparma verrucosa]|uniref:CENP-V/GFA domain-containing protein n=1 Tax=Triparma verrucosa TaxID=1606542 RepID=A0A9W7EVP8_9STRA|nr:hypothetical protein TrVE_jg12293 [Triparma verrucosa]